MSWGAVAVAGATIVGSIIASDSQKKASKNASQTAATAQERAAALGIEAQERALKESREILAPYVQAGNNSMIAQMDLLGLNGNEAQQNAINQIKESSSFGEIVRQGEDAILQNASATGNLRGGNVQAALSKYRPSVLNNLIQNQFQNLGNISQLGQASAAGVGAASQNTAGNIANLYGNQGAAQAGAAIARGQADATNIGNINQAFQFALSQFGQNRGGNEQFVGPPTRGGYF